MDELVKFLLIAFAVVAAAVAYVWLSWLIVVNVFWPLLPYLLLGGVATGAVVGLAIVLLTLGAYGGLAAPVVGPDATHDPRWFRPTRTAFPRDQAWPQYLAGQARADLRTAWRNAMTAIAATWAASVDPFRSVPLRLLWGVTLLFPLAFLVAATVGGAAACGASLLACVAALTPLLLAWLLVVGAARTVDRVVRRRRDALAGCPHVDCYEVSQVPSFRCVCQVVHRDIRPGVLGALRRRCRCGRALRTTVLRAGGDAAVLCPRCDRALPAGAGAVRDIRIPVIGPVSAGKTRFVNAAMLALQSHLDASGALFEPVDARSARALADGAELVRTQATTSKTQPHRPPAAISARIGPVARPALLHLFDPAGELLREREQNRTMTFLDEAQGFVLIVDPFSVPEIAEQLAGPLKARYDEAHPAQDDPESAYHVTAQRLRDSGVDLRSRRSIAVVVVKADLLLHLPPAEALSIGEAVPTSAEIRGWLCSHGMDNLVLAAERDFAEARYFLVSSWTGWRVGHPQTTVAPLLWLADRAGLRLGAVETRAPEARVGVA